jgi:mannan endo-1,4-beta-mannosidase
MIGLAENGTIPDPELLIEDNARWLFFITWSDLFVVHPKNGKISDQYNELQHFIDVYDSKSILTLDELPKW